MREKYSILELSLVFEDCLKAIDLAIKNTHEVSGIPSQVLNLHLDIAAQFKGVFSDIRDEIIKIYSMDMGVYNRLQMTRNVEYESNEYNLFCFFNFTFNLIIKMQESLIFQQKCILNDIEYENSCKYLPVTILFGDIETIFDYIRPQISQNLLQSWKRPLEQKSFYTGKRKGEESEKQSDLELIIQGYLSNPPTQESQNREIQSYNGKKIRRSVSNIPKTFSYSYFRESCNCGSQIFLFGHVNKCSVCAEEINKNIYSFQMPTEITHPEKHASNYRSILVYSKKSFFCQVLQKISNELHISSICVDNFSDPWLRDIFILGKLIYIRSKKEIRVVDSTHPQSLQRSNFLATHTYFTHIKHYHELSFHSKIDYNDTSGTVSQKRLGAEIFLDQIDRKWKRSIRAAEGGNIIYGFNKEGRKIYFIGENALLNEIDISRQKKKIPHVIRGDFEAYYQEYFEKALARYRKILGTDEVYLLPQWAYHLDLIMAYIGRATFLLHCFREAQVFASYMAKNAAEEGDRKAFAAAADLAAADAKTYSEVIDLIEAILIEKGFHVIRCGAALHQQPTVEQRNTLGRWTSVVYTYFLWSSFINGIDVYSNGQCFFLTNNSPSVDHKKYFERLLNSHNIQVRFLDVQNDAAVLLSGSGTMNKIRDEGGAVRCQTIYVEPGENYQLH